MAGANIVNASYILSQTRLTDEISGSLHLAVDKLFNDMQDINPADLEISEYNQKYLGEKLKNANLSLSTCACIIGGALSGCKKPLAEDVFIDYGGGTGFLSMLAKRMGIGTVIYSDIYDVSCKDAKRIASALGCQADHYVQGNIDDLVKFCVSNKTKCDIMVSYDVLEHIYDIEDFCAKLHLLSQKDAIIVHASGANRFFYPYLEATSRMQIEAETTDRKKQWGHKERDCLSSYLGERKKIIRQYSPTISDSEVEQLARVTRGLRQEAIFNRVDHYLQTSELPIPIEDPTNTCDPYTGNWLEHLMNPYYIAETLTFNGFEAQVVPIYWYEGGRNFIKGLAIKLANFAIRHLNAALYLSQGYAIWAKYDSFSPVAEKTHKHHLYKLRRSYFWRPVTTLLWKLPLVHRYLK